MNSRAAIELRVKDFVADLERLVRTAALDVVQAALGDGGEAKSLAPRPAARGPSARTTAATKPAAAKAVEAAAEGSVPAEASPSKPSTAAKSVASATVAKSETPKGATGRSAEARAAGKSEGRRKGQKRTQAELAALQARLEGFVKANDGKRIEEISKSLGVPTSDLAGPMKKLIDGAKVRTTGERRATRYYSARRK
jgi:flagellar biosynthesis/type III secretory pathway protein FliH